MEAGDSSGSTDSLMEGFDLMKSEIKATTEIASQSLDEMTAYLAENRRKHEELMKNSQAQINELQVQLKVMTDTANENKEKLQERANKMREMRHLASEIERESERLKNEKTLAELNVEQTKENNRRIREVLEQHVADFEKLRFSLEKYQDVMGLQLKVLSVSECEPPVPKLAELSAKLNETNNFRSFILSLRDCFTKLC